MAEFRQVLVLNPLFNFSYFFEKGLLTDCEIHVFEIEGSQDYQVIRAHRAILSNSSEFFENMFTSGMIEAKTGILEIRGIYQHLVQVVRYLYSGDLQFVNGSVMQLLSLATHYGIHSLRSLLSAYIQQSSPEVLLGFIAQCFNYELADELRFLEDFVARHYSNISMHNLSTALDVVTFVHVLAKVEGRSLSEKFSDLIQFLGDWECSAQERAAIGALFKTADPTLQRTISAQRQRLLPEKFHFG
jgi:hypothetical protein